MRRMTSAIALTFGAMAPAAHGVVIYELVSGTNSSTVQNANADLVSQTGYVRGSGLSSNAGGTFNSAGFNTAASADAAVANGDFITWGFSLLNSYDLDSFSIRYDRSGTGPAQLRIELDTGSGFTTVFTDTAVAEAGENNLNISLAAFDNVTSGTFRIAPFNASGTSGTFDFENAAPINNASFQLNGTFNGSGGPDPDPDPDPTPVPTPIAIVADGIIGPGNQAPLISANQLPHPNTLPTGDGFQIHQRGVTANIPFAMLDDSLSIFPGDTQGIIRDGDTGAFFGVTDLVNGTPLSESNPGDGSGTADFRFNIAGMTGIKINIDMAAMGDFDSSPTRDVFDFTYSIDGGVFQSLFTSSIDESGLLNYLLEGGTSFNLVDPLLINGTVLNNIFQTLTANVLGAGNVLTLRFFAQTDGADEAFVFRNIEVIGTPTFGQSGPMPEPTTGLLALAGLMVMGLTRSRRQA